MAMTMDEMHDMLKAMDDVERAIAPISVTLTFPHDTLERVIGQEADEPEDVRQLVVGALYALLLGIDTSLARQFASTNVSGQGISVAGMSLVGRAIENGAHAEPAGPLSVWKGLLQETPGRID